MRNIPFDISGLEDSEVETLLQTYRQLRLKFLVAFGRGGGLHFKKYNLFKEYSHITSKEGIEITHHDFKCYLHVFHVEYTWIGAKGARHKTLENQYYGVVRLNKEFGHVFIRRERISDKIHEIFKPIEVDFENDDEFCRKFYVVAEDSDKAKSAIDTKFRKAVLELNVDNIFIEIVRNQLVIGSKTIMSTHNAIEFVKFMEAISEMN
ncbi:MAG: hypothetical protein V4642_10400 [Bacteroidota bacterium]